MPFFTRPNFEDRQVVQYSGTSVTLSGDTNINPTGNFRIYKDAFPGLVATSLDADGTVGWGPISGISWSISACTSPLYVNNLVSCPLSAGTIQVDAGALTLNSELQFLISLSAGTNTDDILVIDSNGYVKSVPYVNGGSMWYVPYGYTLVVPDNYQSFVYGDLYVLGTIDLQTNAQLVVLNGNIILSGGTIIGSGTTQLVTLGVGNGCCFTGGTGSCITDLYVSNIHSCSPLNINPLDEGNVYFGSTSGLTFDVTNKRLGLNQPNPQWTFDLHSYDKRSKLFYYDNIGPISPAFADVQEVVLSGTSDLNVIIGTLTDGNVSTVIGTRGSTNVGVFGDNVGKVGDGYLATSAYANGLNIMNFPSVLSNREDYIRFYAGNYTTAVSDMHIQGSGATKGYIGMGTDSPSYRLQILGNNSNTEIRYSDSSPVPYFDFTSNDGDKLSFLQVSDTNSTSSFGLAFRGYNETLFPTYGKPGDASLYASVNVNGLNIVNNNGSGKEDYIRFYAGGNPGNKISDIHIQGTGTTTGYVGMGEEDPLTKLHVSGNTILGSQAVFVSDIRPTQTQINAFLNNNRGVRIQYNFTGDSTVSMANSNTSGRTIVTFGRGAGGGGKVFSISNNGDDYIRTATTPVNGFDFYRNKTVFQTGNNLDGVVFNLSTTGNDGRLWFEQNANSPMVIMGGGSPDDLRLGIALNPDGTEMPTAKLQVGGTGTTGTFKYVDGNQGVGKVLTSDADGNTTWQTSSNIFFTDDITTLATLDVNGYRVLYPFTATTSGDYIFDATTRVDLAGVSPTNDITTRAVVNGTPVASTYRTTINVGMTVTHTEKKKLTLSAGDVFHYGVVGPTTDVLDGSMIVFKIS